MESPNRLPEEHSLFEKMVDALVPTSQNAIPKYVSNTSKITAFPCLVVCVFFLNLTVVRNDSSADSCLCLCSTMFGSIFLVKHLVGGHDT